MPSYRGRARAVLHSRRANLRLASQNMNRNILASLGAVLGIAAVLFGTYLAFFALAARIPPGQVLGMIGAALGIGGALACAGIGFVANKWARRQPPAP